MWQLICNIAYPQLFLLVSLNPAGLASPLSKRVLPDGVLEACLLCHGACLMGQLPYTDNDGPDLVTFRGKNKDLRDINAASING